MFLWHKLTRRGLVIDYVVLSVLLVVATALTVATVGAVVVERQIDEAADRRLADGAAFFQASLQSDRDDLLAGGALLAADRELVGAIEAKNPDGAQQRLSLGLNLQAIDEVLAADAGGAALAGLRVGKAADPEESIANDDGFHQALAGRVAQHIDRSVDGLLRQEVYVPVRPSVDGQPIGVLRLASFLDQKDVNRFHARTGLDISLFFAGERIVTTLRRPDGNLSTDVGPDPEVYQQVAVAGHQMYGWQTLPIGEMRSYYVPLNNPDGAYVGMLALTTPVRTLAEELRDAVLPSLPLILSILALGGFLAYLLASGVRAPVTTLALAAGRLRDGDLSIPIPVVKEAELLPIAEQLEAARLGLLARIEAATGEEVRQRAILAAVQEPILTVGSDGRIVDCNAAAVALFGGAYSPQGKPLLELLPFVGALGQGGDNEASWQGSVKSAAGDELDVEVIRAKLVGGLLPEVYVYVLRDVSRYVELSRMREQLLYDVTHELRTPLAALDNALEIIANDYGELSGKDFDRIVCSARRMSRRLRILLDDLLSVGAIHAGRLVVRPKPVDPRLIINEAIEMVGPELASRRQHVNRDLPREALRVLADPRHARVVFTNLLSNASKYGPEGEAIGVRVEKMDGQARIVVEDSGPGIPAQERARLFERFYRAEFWPEKPGVGLGLAIAKSIVEAHGGSIGMDGRKGTGTRVWFTLPLAEEVDDNG